MQVLRHASSIATKPLGGGLLFGDFNGTDVVSDGVSSTQRIGTAQREVDQFREDIKKLKVRSYVVSILLLLFHFIAFVFYSVRIATKNRIST